MNRLLLLLALLASAAIQAEVYRWVDENGVTVYSQTPPPDGEADKVKTAPPPTGAHETRKQLDAQMQQLEDHREDQGLAAEKQQLSDQNQQISKNNCRNAKSNMDALAVAGRRLLKQPDGSYKRLTEEQRQKQLEEARKTIDKYCK